MRSVLACGWNVRKSAFGSHSWARQTVANRSTPQRDCVAVRRQGPHAQRTCRWGHLVAGEVPQFGPRGNPYRGGTTGDTPTCERTSVLCRSIDDESTQSARSAVVTPTRHGRRSRRARPEPLRLVPHCMAWRAAGILLGHSYPVALPPAGVTCRLQLSEVGLPASMTEDIGLVRGPVQMDAVDCLAVDLNVLSGPCPDACLLPRLFLLCQLQRTAGGGSRRSSGQHGLERCPSG